MSVLPVGIGSGGGGGGYQISRSLRFNSADSAYLNRTPASAGTTTTWTWSAWVKRSVLGTQQYLFYAASAGANAAGIDFLNDQLRWYQNNGSQALTTTQVFRDVSSWYHFVVVMDTTNGTSTDRLRMYVNGSRITAFASATYPSSGGSFNNNVAHALGRDNTYGSEYFNGYMTEINFIDGQALTPSSFGQTNASTGVWEPIAYTGTYGTNGFYLKFADNSGTTSTTLGKDSSGNGNNWTPNNFSVTAGAGNDSLVDTPTPYGSDTGAGGEVRGNYATINVLSNLNSTTLSNGNLDFLATSGSSSIFGTIGVSSGKWYWEVVCYEDVMAGVSDTQRSGGTYPGNFANSCAWNTYFSMSTNLYQSGTFTKNGSPSTAGATTGQIIGVALDMDAGNLYFYVNGSVTNSGNPVFNSITGTVFPVFRGSLSTTSSANFGQRPFAYTAPSGFKALCTQNLPTPTIGATSTTQANDYFDVVTWTGNGTNPRSITGVGFQPDFVWAKSRSNALDNTLYDAVRGAGKVIYSNANLAEATNNTFGYLSSFNSDGFTASAGATNNSYFNTNNSTYVAWNWKANGAGSSNTAGTITSTVSANTTSGFSIATFNAGSAGNKTVGHGLGVAPSLWMTKCLSVAGNSWSVGSSALTTPASNYLVLNASSASASDTRIWANAAPTSTVFSFESNYTLPANSNCVAYCFAPVAGYSAFGSYIGNGSDDGPFIYTGFRPRFIMTKAATVAGEWEIYDTARGTYNSVSMTLEAQSSSAELNYYTIDILSNGFKQRRYYNTQNQSGQTFIYAAFAESPFKFSLAR